MSDIIDEIFKKNLNADDVSQFVKQWDLNAAWKRYQQKRKRATQIHFSEAVAVFLPILVTVMIILIIGFNNNKTINVSRLTDEERRAKLREIEERMSGTYIPEYYCETCRRTTINYIQIMEKEMGKTELNLQ
jgi:hypothetical protein